NPKFKLFFNNVRIHSSTKTDCFTVAFIFFLVQNSISNVAALDLPGNYSASARPNQDGVADVVNVSIELLSIRGVSETKSEMTVDIAMHTSWVDARLLEQVSRDTLFVGHIPTIWIPSVQIANSESGSHASSKALHLGKDGLVKYSKKMTTHISCPISLAKYPFDRQACRLQLNSFGYTTLHLVLVWHGTINDDVPTYHPEFSFSYAEQTSENIKTVDGEYSNLFLEVAVSRCPLRVIFRAMLPSVLLLAFSYYVTFCHCNLLRSKSTPSANGHHVEATVVAQPVIECTTPERSLIIVAINGIVLLVIVFVAQMNFIDSPKSSAVSGLDVWLNVITAMVFMILWHSVQLYFNEGNMSSDKMNPSEACYVNRTTNMLKIGIPVVFVVFFVVYCGVYLS
ncbi:Gamma-aminobutyric acid receptor subunit delta, partial [Orchesella cincta]